MSGIDEVKETTPDSLKNTAYNIARLEDAIEQCEGRQKYLARTNSPSDGGDVRWYFGKVPLPPLESAASVPNTEIVGKGDYFRFGMRDSLAIEASFLQREEELLSCWWKEFAECSEGPGGRPTSSKKLDTPEFARTAAQLYEEEEERVGVPVKGGLYEVDLVRRHCFPVYWNGENRRVLRGHWFVRKGGIGWLPIREDVAEQLEIAYRSQVWHRRTFQPSGLFAARVDLQGSTRGLHSLFTGEDDTWEAWLNVDASGFGNVISLSGNGIKLRRGFSESQSSTPTQDELRQQKEEEMDDYCSQVPVGHVIFMVHGIGQRLEKSNVVDDVGYFRQVTASLAEQHLTSHQRGAQRVLFIPCQWRKGLKLSGEEAVEKITLDGVRGLRVMLSATVHDVLYYMSPIHCQDIINSVSNQLNWLYLKFLKRNPGYDGKVSIFGHSLGSVLSYDILCHQENLSSPFPMDWMYKEQPEVEGSSPDRYNQSPKSCSSTNLEGSANVAYEDDKNVCTVDDETTFAQLTLANEGGHERSLLAVSDPPTSNLDTMSTLAADSKESVGKSVDDLVHDSSCTLHGALRRESDKTINNVTENGSSTSNKDEEIKFLKDEIDFLKSRIMELESQFGENKEAIVATLKQPTCQKDRKGLDDTSISYTPYIKYTKLEFEVDTFFAVGSPLGVFLALRNVRIGIGKGQGYWEEENITEEMPACHQMFNIFHPFDPVAYRIEPLVCKEYVTKRPVIIPYHKGGKRLHVGFREFTEDLAACSQAVKDHLNSVRDKVLTVCQSKRLDSLEGDANAPQEEERTYGSIMMERLTGSIEGRIDYMLQEKTFEHPYLQTLGSHTNYWRDPDTALFILKHLYRDIPEEPNVPQQSSRSNLKDRTHSTHISHQREVAEEELPLTFSNRTTIKSFSSKAKKFIK